MSEHRYPPAVNRRLEPKAKLQEDVVDGSALKPKDIPVIRGISRPAKGSALNFWVDAKWQGREFQLIEVRDEQLLIRLVAAGGSKVGKDNRFGFQRPEFKGIVPYGKTIMKVPLEQMPGGILEAWVTQPHIDARAPALTRADRPRSGPKQLDWFEVAAVIERARRASAEFKAARAALDNALIEIGDIEAHYPIKFDAEGEFSVEIQK